MVSHDMQAVLFDLDGTLLDTHDLLLATFRYTARTNSGTSSSRSSVLTR